MAEGLRFVIPAEEIKTHCIGRVAFYEKEIQRLENKVDVWKKKDDGEANIQDYQDLQNELVDAQKAVKQFGYFATHLSTDAYSLDRHDLEHLELIDSSW